MFKKKKKQLILSQSERAYIKEKLEADKDRKKTLKATITFKNDKSFQEFIETSYFKDEKDLDEYSIIFLKKLNSISNKKWKIIKIEKIEKNVNFDNDNEE